jgi:hypothetical protein
LKTLLVMLSAMDASSSVFGTSVHTAATARFQGRTPRRRGDPEKTVLGLSQSGWMPDLAASLKNSTAGCKPDFTPADPALTKDPTGRESTS